LYAWDKSHWATGWMIGASNPEKGWEFFSSLPRPDRLSVAPSPLSNDYQGESFPGGKVAGAWIWPLTPSSAEVKNAWSYTSTPQYAFMAWCSLKKE
jgi:hypothetical protein